MIQLCTLTTLSLLLRFASVGCISCKTSGTFQWNSWGAYEPCDGRRLRTVRSRGCRDDASGKETCVNDCLGYHRGTESSQEKLCKNNANSVDGNWSNWGAWDECNKLCGGGVRHRTRVCGNPEPQGSGRYCVGSAESQGACNQQPCDLRNMGKWMPWIETTQCRLVAGSCIRSFARQCETNKACPGLARKNEPCMANLCKEAFPWYVWVAVSTGIIILLICVLACIYMTWLKHKERTGVSYKVTNKKAKGLNKHSRDLVVTDRRMHSVLQNTMSTHGKKHARERRYSFDTYKERRTSSKTGSDLSDSDQSLESELDAERKRRERAKGFTPHYYKEHN